MFIFTGSILLSVPVLILLKLLFTYLRDEKGFRKYPNQNWASGLTPLAYGWECGRKHKDFHSKRLNEALQKQPVIRIGPNWLAFGRFQAARNIYGYTSKCRKAAPYDLLAKGGQHLNNITEKSVHSARRRMVASFYSPKNFDEWEPKVAASVTVLMMQMDKRCTKPHSLKVIPEEELNFDAVHWLWLYSVETTIKLMLSKDVFFLRNGTDHVHFKDANGKDQSIRSIYNMHNVQRAASTVIWDVDRFAFWQNITTRLSKTYADNWQGGPNFHMTMEALVKERMDRHANGEELNDLFHPMLEDSKGDEPAITTKDRIAEVEQIGAAPDGVGQSLSMTIYFLLRYPHAMAKLREEVDSALSPDDAVAPWEKVKRLPYLRACLDEAMRLTPPVATELIRCTPPDASVIIDGEVIPPNTNVSMAAYTTHRDPTVFEDPETYDPDRWMAKGSDRLQAMLTAFMPFTAGTRACIGRNISMQMQDVCLATMIYHYDFALPYETWEMEFEEYFNLWPLRLPLKVWRRDTVLTTETEQVEV